MEIWFNVYPAMMIRRLALNGGKICLLVAAAISALFLLTFKTQFCEQINLRLMDAKFRLRGRLSPSDKIALVVIDRESLPAASCWPWPRDVIANLVRELSKCRPSVIAFDILPAGNSPGDDSKDDNLSDALREAGDVILPIRFNLSRHEARYQTQAEFAAVLSNLQKLRVNSILQSGRAVDRTDVPRAYGVDANPPKFQSAARGGGFCNTLTSPDGSIRQTPLVMQANGDYYCCLAVSILREFFREANTQLVIDGPRVKELRVGPESIPCDEQGLYLMNYYGSTSAFPAFQSSKILSNNYDRRALEGKIVLVSGIAPGAFEPHASPFNPACSSVEIQATILDNLLTRRFLKQDAHGVGLTLVLLFIFTFPMGILLPLARRFPSDIIVGMGLFAVFFLSDYLIFERWHQNISTLYPALSILIGYIATSRYIAHKKETSYEFQRQNVLQLSNELNRISGIEGLLPNILRAFMKITGAERGLMALVKSNGSTGDVIDMDTICSTGGIDLAAEGLSFLRAVTGRVIRDKQPVFIPAVKKSRECAEIAEKNEQLPRYLICIPLMGEKKMLGIVYLDSSQPLDPFGLDMGLLISFANQSAVAISNSILYSMMQDYSDKVQRENIYLMGEVEAVQMSNYIIGNSPEIHRVLYLIRKASESTITVLIEGETGTGKELVAREIHFSGPRRDQMFVAQNCSAFPEDLLESELFGYKKGAFTGAVQDKKGLFEIADKGTIFLDEVADMTAGLQSKLLRALEEGVIRPVGSVKEKRVDIRILSATNKNLAEEVKTGRFREDLFYRLNAFPIHVPPLRERRDDIPILIAHFVDRLKKKLNRNIRGISSEAVTTLLNYDFPGNVRELENEIEKAAVMTPDGELITTAVLSYKIKRAASAQSAVTSPVRELNLRDALDTVTKEMVVAAMAKCRGNKSRSAKELGLSRKGLDNIIARLKINHQSSRRG